MNEFFMKPDLVMILSGEDVERRHRSRRAIELYRKYNENVPILISGSHSGYLGRELPEGMIRECWQIKEFLLSEGVPEEAITCEERSLDTLGNFYLSHSIIKDDQEKIDLVTDAFHMMRSLWCSELVFGNTREFNPQSTTQKINTRYQKWIESLQVALLSRDMKRYCVKNGDYGALTRFMKEVHPFYCGGKAKPSNFGLMVKVLKNKKLLRMLPTQRQAYKDL